jgi:hypothetical protein
LIEYDLLCKNDIRSCFVKDFSIDSNQIKSWCNQRDKIRKEWLKMSKSLSVRKLATGLFAIATIAVMLLMAGCSNRDDELVGRWVSADDPAWVTTFNADGTGTHTISWGYGTTFQWSTPNNNIRWNYPGHPNMDSPYRISGNALYITLDDGFTFRYIRD